MDIVRKQTGENTRAVHLPAPPTPSQQPLGTPVFRTASFAFGTAEEYRAVLNDEMPGYTYSRIDNPTVDAFARAVAALEGVNLPHWPAAQAFASGMAAISGVFWTFARAGAHVVASSAVYGGTFSFLRNVITPRRSPTRPRQWPTCASWPRSRTTAAPCWWWTRRWPPR